MTPVTHGQVYEVTKDIVNPLPDKRAANKHDWRTWKVIPKGTHLRGHAIDANHMFMRLVRADDTFDVLHPLEEGPLWSLLVEHIKPIDPALIDVLCEWHQDTGAILNKLIAMGKVSMAEVIKACKVMKHEADAELAAWEAKKAKRPEGKPD